MPNYTYRCEKCENQFECFHGMTENAPPCTSCESLNVKKIITPVSFKVQGGSEKSSNSGYTGKHRELVSKRKGNKNYRDGHRKEVNVQEKLGLQNYKEDEKMRHSQSTFEKMREEGMKMTSEEKEKIKAEYGIKKGKTNAGEIKF